MTMKTAAGINVHPIGIGTWTMGGVFLSDKSAPFVELGGEDKYIEAIRYSISKGQNHIDTAFCYGLGHCEEIVGQAIKDLDRKKLFVASKVWKSHVKRTSVVRGIEDMLIRLKTNYLDLVYLHAYWDYEPLEEQIGGLNDAVEKGLVKAIGLSNYNLEQLMLAVMLTKHPIVALQNQYNVLVRTDVPKELLRYCQQHEITLVAYRPIAKGLLGDQCDNKVVLDLARKYNRTPAQIALNWLISQKGVVAIPKSVKMEHIDENLKSMDFVIDKIDRKRLDEI